MTVAVADAGPIIHLGQLDSLALLAGHNLYIPETVIEELRAGDSLPSDRCLDYERVDVQFGESHPELDAGERAAIALATQRECMLMTDDFHAREVAMAEGIEVHGTVGLIVRGYATDKLDGDEAKALLWTLQEERNLFVSDGVIERGIALLHEHVN